MTEPMARPVAAISLALIAALALVISLSPHLGSAAWVLGAVVALAILYGVVRRATFDRPAR
jgi:hypothetical protein